MTRAAMLVEAGCDAGGGVCANRSTQVVSPLFSAAVPPDVRCGFRPTDPPAHSFLRLHRRCGA